MKKAMRQNHAEAMKLVRTYGYGERFESGQWAIHAHTSVTRILATPDYVWSRH